MLGAIDPATLENQMETAFLELLKASPLAGAMLILVFVFLKALKERDERFDQITKGVIEANTAALRENAQILATCKFVQQMREK